jgi:hypothetical protein
MRGSGQNKMLPVFEQTECEADRLVIRAVGLLQSGD